MNLQNSKKDFCKIINQSFICAALLVFVSAITVSAATGLDTTFGTDGKTIFNAGGNTPSPHSIAFGVAIDPSNGKIYAGGAGQVAVALPDDKTGITFTRFNADGSPDTTFGASGKRIVSFPVGDGTYNNGTGRGIVVLADGSVIQVGNISDGSAVIVKMTNTGVLDTAFGGGTGIFTTNFGTSGASFNAVALQTDGKIIAVGSANNNFVTARFTSAGDLDTTFGMGGFVLTSFAGADVAAGAAIQTDGKIVVGGRASNDCALVRYNANGSLDTSFGTGGKIVTAVAAGNPDQISEVLIQPDGKILGLGTVSPNGSERHLLLRYSTNGMLDGTFGTNGIAGGFFGNNQEFLTGGKLLSNGKIVVVGYIGRNATVARYNADGSVDRGFICGGFGWVFFDPTRLSYFYDVAVQPDGKLVAVGQASNSTLTNNNFALARFVNPNTPAQCAANDFERDGISDLSVFRPSNNNWYLNRSTNPGAFVGTQFGLSADKLAPADYDGDGKTDIAVWRENVAGNQAYFYILNSIDNSVRIEQFGLTGDKLTVGDWDGDGKADLSTYRDGAQSYFYYRGSLNNPAGNVTYLPWGTTGDNPLRGDFDADGKQDAAVYRGSNQVWYIRNSSNGQVNYTSFGLASDRFVPADYDGDGKTDVAVFRPSNSVWYILQSSNGQIRYQTFGLSGDNLVPADYDGDGKADVSVFRNGVWYILQSSNNQVGYQNFGSAGDKPVQTDQMN